MADQVVTSGGRLRRLVLLVVAVISGLSLCAVTVFFVFTSSTGDPGTELPMSESPPGAESPTVKHTAAPDGSIAQREAEQEAKPVASDTAVVPSKSQPGSMSIDQTADKPITVASQVALEPVAAQPVPSGRAETPPQRPAASPAIAVTSGNPGVLSREGVEQLKRSTVFVRVDAGPESGSGSGFILRKEGRTGFIVTNSHVVSLRSGKTGKTTVVVNSGQRNEVQVAAEVVANHPIRDLAILKVETDTLPETIPSMDSVELYETLPVYISGFPFGKALASGDKNPAITISRGSVSSIRRDDDDRIVGVQLDGSINPGNSGGPIVAANGTLIGIAVAKLMGTQIGMAIPVRELHELLRGESGPVLLQRTNDGGSKTLVECTASLMDPMSLIDSVSLHFAETLPAEAKPDVNGHWQKLSGPNVRDIPVTVESGVISVNVELPHNTAVMQISLTRKDGSVQWSAPAKVEVAEVGTVVVLYRGEVVTLTPAEIRAIVEAARPRILPRENAVGTELKLFGKFEAGKPSLVRSCCWSIDGNSVFTLSTEGTVTKYSVLTREKMAEYELRTPCTDIMLCSRGILVLTPGQRTAMILDDEDFSGKGRLELPESHRVTCAPELPEIYVASMERTVVSVNRYNISRGSSSGIFSVDERRIELPSFTVSPDGKYFFAESGRSELLRMRVDGRNLSVEERSPVNVVGRKARIAFSADSKFVAVQSAAGVADAPNHPKMTYGFFVYRVDDLSKPHVALHSGAYPQAVAFDVLSGAIYANNRDAPLNVYNERGKRERQLKSGRYRPTEVYQILPHPSGFSTVVLTDQYLLWGDVGDVSEDQ